MKKEFKDPFMKLRIIVSTLALIIILGGWVVYGVSISYSNPNKVLVKLSKEEKKRIPTVIEKANLKGLLNSKIDINDNKTVYLHNSNNKLYLINNDKYYDITKKLDITINNKSFDSKKYASITESIFNAIVYNHKLLELDHKKDKAKKIYLYSYTLPTLEPAILTLKSDIDFINNMEDLYGIKQEKLYKILNKFNDKRLSLNIYTKGYTRDIMFYTLQIEDLLSVNISKKKINGFILEQGFEYKNNKLTLYTENNNYNLNTTKSKTDIDGKEESSLKKVLDFYK